MTNDEVLQIFTYQSPTPAQAEVYAYVGAKFRELAIVLNEQLPDGPGKTVALRKLAEARMQANACVALNGKF